MALPLQDAGGTVASPGIPTSTAGAPVLEHAPGIPVVQPGQLAPAGAPVVVYAPGANPLYTNPSAPPPVPPPAPSGGGGTGFSLLDVNPAYQQALALQQAGIASSDAQLKAARERAIITFGDPSLAAQAGFGLDPQAAAFAQQNYLSGNSTLARLDRAHQLAQRADVNGLVAHGLLNSGDLGYLSGQENQNYGNNVYDARQAVLDQLANLYGSYLGQTATYGDNVVKAISDAISQYLSNPDAYSALLGGGGSGGGSVVGTDPAASVAGAFAGLDNLTPAEMAAAAVKAPKAPSASRKTVPGVRAGRRPLVA